MFIRWKTAGRAAGFLLSLLMLLSQDSSAAEPVTEIGSAEALLAFAQSVDGGESYAGRTVSLTDDIDMAGRTFTAIGRPDLSLSHLFQGTFNGGGHAITGLAVTPGKGGDSVGLFAELYNATVKNLVLDVSVAANGPGAVGGLAGWMVNGTVKNVLVAARITAARWDRPEDGSAAAGIIAGKATGRTVMDRCAARGSVNGAGSFRWAVYVGGFLGYIQGGGSICNCYTTAGAYANDAGVYVGGFFGGAVNPPTVRNSYAAAYAVGSAATTGAYAGYCTGGTGSAVNVWYDGELNGALPGVAAPADSALSGALCPETTAVMQDSVFPSRLSDAFCQAAPGQNRGYPVLDLEAPAPPPATEEPSSTPRTVSPTEEPVQPSETPAIPTKTPTTTSECSPSPTAPPATPAAASTPRTVYLAGGGAGTGSGGAPAGGGSTLPKTGDGTALLPWAALLILCAGALAGILRRRGPF